MSNVVNVGNNCSAVYKLAYFYNTGLFYFIDENQQKDLYRNTNEKNLNVFKCNCSVSNLAVVGITKNLKLRWRIIVTHIEFILTIL